MTDKQLVATFCELVSIDSPSGSEANLAKFIRSCLKNLNIESSLDASGNLFARVLGIGDPLILSAHLDTVEPGRGIQPVVDRGVIKSSGPTILGADNKAALAAILCALHEANPAQLRSLELVFSTREETDGGAADFDFSQLKGRVGLSADRASAVGTLVTASPWVVNLQIDVYGKSAHAGQPEAGINALTIASRAICSLKWGRLNSTTTANLGLVSGGSAMNSIPDAVHLTGEVRSFSEKLLWRAVDRITSQFTAVAQAHGGTASFHQHIYCRGYRYSRSHPALKRVVQAFHHLGLTPVYETAFGASDANTFVSHGISLVNIGDGVHHPHTTEENISVAALVRLKHVILSYITHDFPG